MKKVLILLFVHLCIIAQNARAQLPVSTKNLRIDFGAVGDGSSNDTHAFLAAAQYFNSLDYTLTTGELVIPYYQSDGITPATYLVGLQLEPGQSVIGSFGTTIENPAYPSSARNYRYGIHIFDIKDNVDGLVIRSDNGMKAKIKYKGGMLHGAFLPMGYTFKLYAPAPCNSNACLQVVNEQAMANETNIPAYGCDSCNSVIPQNALLSCDCDPDPTIVMYYGQRVAVQTITNNSNFDIPLPNFAPPYQSANSLDHKTYACIGSLFVFNNSKNILIQDLELDGNNGEMIYGGKWGDVGIQADHRGIYLSGGENCKIQNVNSHNFALDGMEVAGANNVEVIHCEFDYNGRCAMAWTGGDLLKAFQSKFRYTGKVITSNNFNVGFSPNCGVDIEPEGSLFCTNGTFDNCEFKDCSATLLGNDYYGDPVTTPPKTYNVKFINKCLFDKAPDVNAPQLGYGIWIQGRKLLFDDCDIRTNIIYSGFGLVPGEETIYNNCRFDDSPNWSPYAHMVTFSDRYKTQFKNCTFKIDESNTNFMSINVNSLDESKWTIIDNCSFDYHYPGNPNGANPTQSSLAGVVFRNNNIFKNTLNATNSYHLIAANLIKVEGSSDACSPSSLTLEGSVKFRMTQGDIGNSTIGNIWVGQFKIGKQSDGVSDGYAQVNFGNKSLLCSQSEIEYEIGKFSSLNLGNDASIFFEGTATQFITGKTTINLGGLLHAKANSYLSLSSAYFNQISPNASFYLDQTCNANGNTTSTNWISGGNVGASLPNPIANWLGNYYLNPTPCIQGGHISLPICQPNTYSNIATGSFFSVLYNTTNNVCAGGNSGSISFNGVGGLAPYSASLGTGVGTPNGNSFTGLTAGLYTLTITDANNCTQTPLSIPFEITEPTAISWTSTASSNITCNNANDGSIQVAATGGTGTISYTLQPGNSTNTNGAFTALSSNIYTVTASDGNLCSLTTTINITNPLPVEVAIVNFVNQDCNANTGSIEVSASGGTSAMSYSIVPNSGITQTGNLFTNVSAGVYTITATDINNCSSTTKIIINQPGGDHCACLQGETLVSSQNMFLLSNISAIDVINNYNNGNPVISGKTFYFDGQITIDHDITFDGCILWFAPNSTIQLISGNINFNVINSNPANTSVMQASCDWWEGIVADGSGNKVKLQNSMIKDMMSSIWIDHNAILEAQDTRFSHNMSSAINFQHATVSNYASSIYHCDFEFESNNPVATGITIADCNNIAIGDLNDVNAENHFTDLENGIVVIQGLNCPTSEVSISNNSFEKIRYLNPAWTNIDKEKIDHVFSEAKGSAIYIVNSNSTSPSGLKVKVENATSSNLMGISHCDKGVVSKMSSVDVKNMNIENAYVGVAHELTTLNEYHIDDNHLTHVFNGILFYGDQQTSSANGNTIVADLLSSIPTTFGMGASYYWPKGIEVRNYSTNLNSAIKLNSNIIDIDAYAGIGISMAYTGNSTETKHNTITLNNNSAGQIVCAGATNLAGIAAYKNMGSSMVDNTVTGNTSGQFLYEESGRVDAAGILIDNCDQQQISCNTLLQNRFGLLGINQNNSSAGSELKVQGNYVDGADMGWVFRHLSNEGGLGNVGDAANDNNNMFDTGIPIKVFKYCEGNDGFYIYTNLFSQNASQSYNMNTGIINDCWYLVQSNPSSTLFNLLDCQNMIIPPGNVVIRIDEALAIANNTKSYVEFDYLGRWFDMKRLFAYLKSNPGVRNSYPVLLTFYNDHLNDAIGHEYTADEQLYDMITSFPTLTPAQQAAKRQAAANANNEIMGSELQDENERMVNGLYLKILVDGYETLSEEEATWIQETAMQCPYVAGNAVYKARTLNGHYKPAEMYDDLKICNAVGVFKSSESNNTFNSPVPSKILMETKTLEQIKTPIDKIRIQEGDFVVYPNPASDRLTILHDAMKESVLTIYDAIGNKKKEIILPIGRKMVEINLSEFVSGNYVYVQRIEGITSKIGKFTKIE